MATKFNTGKEIYLEHIDGKHRVTYEHTFMDFDTYEEALDMFIQHTTLFNPNEEHNRRIQEYKDYLNKRTPGAFYW